VGDGGVVILLVLKALRGEAVESAMGLMYLDWDESIYNYTTRSDTKDHNVLYYILPKGQSYN
jgi:hypothetical protein